MSIVFPPTPRLPIPSLSQPSNLSISFCIFPLLLLPQILTISFPQLLPLNCHFSFSLPINFLFPLPFSASDLTISFPPSSRLPGLSIISPFPFHFFNLFPFSSLFSDLFFWAYYSFSPIPNQFFCIFLYLLSVTFLLLYRYLLSFLASHICSPPFNSFSPPLTSLPSPVSLYRNPFFFKTSNYVRS